jgi:hypothetical protein
MRHKFLEWTRQNKRATFDSTLRPFQSVELFLHRMLPSRADVRFNQQNKLNQLTQFIEQTPQNQAEISLITGC